MESPGGGCLILKRKVLDPPGEATSILDRPYVSQGLDDHRCPLVVAAVAPDLEYPGADQGRRSISCLATAGTDQM